MMQSKITSQDKAINKHKATAIKRKTATTKFGTRLATRTKRVAAKSIAAYGLPNQLKTLDPYGQQFTERFSQFEQGHQ
jgi:hypothetical protein